MSKRSPQWIILFAIFPGTLNSGWVFLGISVQDCIMGKSLTCSNGQRILKGNGILHSVSGIASQNKKLTTWTDYQLWPLVLPRELYFCWFPACKTSPSIVVYPHQIVLRQNYAPFPPICIPCYTYLLERVGDFPYSHRMINHSNRKHVTQQMLINHLLYSALYNCDYPLYCGP